MLRPLYLIGYAQSGDHLGDRAAAIAALDDALAAMEQTGERTEESGIWRVRAGLTNSIAERRTHLSRTLAVARQQGALWLALYAATELVEIADGDALRGSAEQELRGIFAQITEGRELPIAERARLALGLP